MSRPTGISVDFFRRLASPGQLGELFDYLPDTYFYAKDLGGRFVMVNRALAAMYGLPGPGEMIGRTDHDFSPPDLADQYVAEDHRVIQSGRPIVNQAWLIPDSRRVLKWYLSSKIPLFDERGEILGIAGAMRDVEKATALLEPFRQMEGAMHHIFAHFTGQVEIGRLARLVGLSVSQFDRRFKQLFCMPPRQFILRVRLNAACRMLASTEEPVAGIALKTGFYDQSYFTKQFKRHTGRTPRGYRRQYQGGLAAASDSPLP